jgi:hypothetical protein
LSEATGNVDRVKLLSDESPSWTDDEWEQLWKNAKAQVLSDDGRPLVNALDQDLNQLKDAVLNLERDEIPRVWQRSRRATYEVSLLECFAVRIGQVRVELDHEESDLGVLLLEREKKLTGNHEFMELQDREPELAERMRQEDSLARSLRRLLSTMKDECPHWREVDVPTRWVARLYEDQSLPDFLRYRVVLLRVLLVSLWAPPGTDLLFHVPGDVRRMQEMTMPTVFALQQLCESLWAARE